MKTNVDFLRELIKDNDEAIEFLDAIEKEMDDKDDEISGLNEEVNDLQSEVKSLEEDEDNLIEIDCGIGTIRYEEPDNLKLHTIMEELKEKLEHEAKFGTAPILSML